MAEAADDDMARRPKRGKKGLLLGLILALPMGAVGYFLATSGFLATKGHSAAESGHSEISAPPKIAFVEIEPVLIALARESERRHLRFRGNLEVNATYEEDVRHLMPRILDVMNSYLRAVEIRQLEDPAGLLRLRAQMLRRIQIVAGDGMVRDLLISEFVLN